MTVMRRGSVGLAALVPPRLETVGLAHGGTQVRGEAVEIGSVVRRVHVIEHGADLILIGGRPRGGDPNTHQR